MFWMIYQINLILGEVTLQKATIAQSQYLPVGWCNLFNIS